MVRTSTKPRRGSSHHLTPAFSLFRPSYRIVRKNIWIFGPLYAVPLLFAIHAWIWEPSNYHHNWWNPFNGLGTAWSSSASSPTYTWYNVLSNSILWFVFVIVVGTVIKIMTQAAQLEGAEGKSISFDNLWKTTKELGWRMLGLYILSGVFITVGFILLIIPGLIMIRRYYLAPYVMLDKKPKSIMEAMNISAKMSKPSPNSSDWTLFSRGIWSVIGVTILIGLLGIIPIIGWFASFLLGMFYSVAPAMRYQELKNLS